MQGQRAAYVPSMASGRGQMLPGLGIRPALVLGFGLTIGIWVLAYYYFSQRIEAVERRQSALNAGYQTAQDLLTVVRSEVFASAVATRNTLLESDPGDTADYRKRIDGADAAVEAALSQYVSSYGGEPSLDTPVQRAQITLLRHEVDEFRAKIEQLVAHRAEWPHGPSTALNQEITPPRDAAMSVAESLLRLNREGFIEEQAKIGADYKTAQQGILGALGLALLASLGVAVALSRYTGRLEFRVRQQLARDADHALDLQRLTGRLVTAQEEERRRIARELHDEVGQVLTVVKFALRDAQSALGTSGTSADLLEEARVVSDRALQTIRDLSRLLHPSLLDDMGLPVAVEAYLQGFRKRHGVEITSGYDNLEERLAPNVEIAIYRVVQEAMTNIARHARATACRVHLHRTGDSVDITIDDNGIGFDAVAATQPGPTRGLGLLGMQERVAQLGGEMVLDSSPGRGARLFASVSVLPESQQGDPSGPLSVPEPEGSHA